MSGLQKSVNDLNFTPKYFDIILAEGLFTSIGFEGGLSLVNKFIKDNGYTIIHDESTNQESKKEIIKRFGFRLIHLFILNDKVWWKDYYRCLEKKISAFDVKITSTLFSNEIREINLNKEQPWLFSSMYFILIKTN